MPEIAIDACVFIHLLNPQNNTDSHIDQLLRQLFRDKFMLLVDSSGKIGQDYQSQVIPIIKKTNDTGSQLNLLRYWMHVDRQFKVDMNRSDELMTAIKHIIHEMDEHADRAFVYVAFHRDTALITNDNTHILNRRTELLRKTKKCRGHSSDILSSRDATCCFCNSGGH